MPSPDRSFAVNHMELLNFVLCYKNILRTSAVSSTNFGSKLIFASCYCIPGILLNI